jgi:gliding motility-associated-like protein
MQRAFLTQVFNPIPVKFSYFNKKQLTLKTPLALLLLLISFSCSLAQGPGNIEFVENKGQWDDRVQFKGSVSGGSFLIRNGGFTIVQHNAADLAALGRFSHGFKMDGSLVTAEDKIVVRSHAYHVDFVGASAQLKTVPDKLIPTYNNYFIGNNPSKWASNCQIFQAITMQDVYPNVDVRYYTDNGFLKYDIIVKPGADISKIALKYDGVNQISVKNKELIVKTSIGDLKESSPYTYQSSGKTRATINCRYVVKDNIVRFDVKDYDPSSTLVIDPTLIFCSFSGSSADNWGFTATYGPDGSMYGGGIVFEGVNAGSSFPTSPGAFQTTFQGGNASGPDTGPIDIGIIKLSPNGSNRIYATYIGGAGNEQPHSLVVDGQGNLVLAGRSNSTNYPLVGAGGQIGSGGGMDIVVTKLNANGTLLLGSRKIGGAGNDGVNISVVRGPQSLQRNYGDDGRSEVILDGSGNVYVASSTQSFGGSPFPVTPGAFQTTYGGGSQDGVVLKFNSSLSSLIFASYLGGSANDAAYVLSLAPNGDIFVAGGTESGDLLPGTQAGTLSSTNAGQADGFVAQISNNGSSVIRSTYLGTAGIDQVFGVQFDNIGFPYVMGQTTGSWPVVNAPYSNPNSKQFIAKLQPDLSNWVYSTVFGSGSSTPNISPIAFLVDKCENVYISGWGGFFFGNNAFNSAGTSGMPITSDAIQSSTDGKDLYIFVLKKNATQQLFGTFWGEVNPQNQGSDHVDGGTSRFDKNGVIYQAICGNCLLGNTSHLSYPVTPGAWSTSNNAFEGGGCNLTMLKMALNLSGVDAGVRSAINGVPRDTAGCVPLKVDFSDTVRNGVSYEWNFGDGSPTITTTVPDTSHIYTSVGTYQVMLVAIDPNTCNIRDTSYMNIRVGDIQATLAFDDVKLLPCDSFKYRFDNLSTAPLRPFGPQSFVWDFGDGSPRITAGLNPVFHNFPAPGPYIVKLILQDSNYCNAPDSISLPVNVAINVKARFTTEPVVCMPDDAEFQNESDAGQTYLWDFGDGITSTDSDPVHQYTTAGTYTVVLIAYNPSTCNLSDTARFTVTVYAKPVASFSYTPIPPIENTPNTFTNLSSPDAVLFKWEFGDGDSLVTPSRAPVVHQYNSVGPFSACLTAYNAVGCSDSVCQQVTAIIVPLVDVPNAFTPQSGDINSVVRVRGFGIAKMRFIIWNRWGQKVFETNNRNDGWDGKVKGMIQPMDVYAYTLDVEFFDGTKATKKGDITLIR